jgi:hypothetical protein
MKLCNKIGRIYKLDPPNFGKPPNLGRPPGRSRIILAELTWRMPVLSSMFNAHYYIFWHCYIGPHAELNKNDWMW